MKQITKQLREIPSNINKNCKTDRAREIETEGAAKAPRAEIETIIISKGLAMLASTAD